MKFKATWSTLLIVMTVLSIPIFLGFPFFIAYLTASIAQEAKPPPPILIPLLETLGILMPAILVICSLFTVRGYTLLADAILVKRLFWETRVSLDGLRSATFEPNVKGVFDFNTLAMNGCYAFAGLFWNRKLGSHRAYVTNFAHTVVLRFENRTVVLSPDPPEQFVSEVLKNRGIGSENERE